MQNDFIMRIIEQFVQVIQTIARRRQEGKYQEALQLIDQTCRSFLRTPLHILPFCDPEEILETLDREHYALVEDLLQELLLIKEATQQQEGVQQIKTLCALLRQKQTE
ncbi:MAG: hypothetical protein K2Y01_10855 [Rhabdochlamydiaceae bacterium]|nr:hypothetical protein [Rhabdochlamydiaceae bacterium]